MNSLIRQQLQARLEKVQERIALAETGLAEASASGVQTFELDTGEADQKVIFRSLRSAQRYLDALYQQEEWLTRRLCGEAFPSARVRRKP